MRAALPPHVLPVDEALAGFGDSLAGHDGVEVYVRANPNTLDESGLTPLDQAALRARLAVAQMLIDRGRNGNAPGFTPACGNRTNSNPATKDASGTSRLKSSTFPAVIRTKAATRIAELENSP